jgi:hypothetical protein|nr:MAG TPA: tail assembly chaperone [Caudoviricetes sp.]
MFELEINGQVYEFNFGMGFLRELNKRVSAPVDGLPDVKKNIGLQYVIAGVIDGDLEDLVEVLDCANRGKNPRVTKQLLDEYIDNENTDIELLFESVINFLKSANATKKTTLSLLEELEKQKKKMEEKEKQKQ